MHQLEQIAVDCTREDWLGDGLPANDDSEVHGSENFLSWSVNESLASIPNSVNEIRDSLATDNRFAAIECVGHRGVEWNILLTEPDPIVELFDAIIAVFHDLMDLSIASLWMV